MNGSKFSIKFCSSDSNSEPDESQMETIAHNDTDITIKNLYFVWTVTIPSQPQWEDYVTEYDIGNMNDIRWEHTVQSKFIYVCNRALRSKTSRSPRQTEVEF